MFLKAPVLLSLFPICLQLNQQVVSGYTFLQNYNMRMDNLPWERNPFISEANPEIIEYVGPYRELGNKDG